LGVLDEVAIELRYAALDPVLDEGSAGFRATPSARRLK
jgi:hypothetical protein